MSNATSSSFMASTAAASAMESPVISVREWTRKRSLDLPNPEEIPKRSRYSYYIRLESESSLASEEDTESIYSVQGYETDIARDTPDTDTKSECSDSDGSVESVEFEYDVASLSEPDDNPLNNDSSSSGTEGFFEAATASAIAAAICETSLEAWATDGEDSDNDSIDGVGLADFWTCVQCKSRNNNPRFRYCQKCFQVRKNFFPPRPRGYRRKARKSPKPKRQRKPSVHIDSLRSCLSQLSQDSGISSQESQISSQEVLSLDLHKIVVPPNLNESSSSSILDKSDLPGTSHDSLEMTKSLSGARKRKSSDLEDVKSDDKAPKRVRSDEEASKSVNSDIDQSNQSLTVNDPSVGEKERSESAPKGLCIICNQRAMDSVFVHGPVGHTSTCYKCAMRTWRINQKCPICNCRANNVIKVFSQ